MTPGFKPFTMNGYSIIIIDEAECGEKGYDMKNYADHGACFRPSWITPFSTYIIL